MEAIKEVTKEIFDLVNTGKTFEEAMEIILDGKAEYYIEDGRYRGFRQFWVWEKNEWDKQVAEWDAISKSL